MSMPDEYRNFLSRIYGEYVAPMFGGEPEAKNFSNSPPVPLTPEQLRAQEAHNYLRQLSRSTKRGQDFARMADETRAMLRTMQTTQDPNERRAIVQAMQNSGMFPRE